MFSATLENFQQAFSQTFSRWTSKIYFSTSHYTRYTAQMARKSQTSEKCFTEKGLNKALAKKVSDKVMKHLVI